MLYLIMFGAIAIGVVCGGAAHLVLRRLLGPPETRRGFYLRSFAAWFVGLASYAIATETYRPMFSWIWLGEAILGGDLMPITGFAAFLAYASLTRWGPQPSGGTA